MILSQTSIIRASDLSRFAWAGLRNFQNVDNVERRLVELHRIEKKHRSNARKQANQIRFCLLQAREYFDAAQAVTLATRPVLMYYAAMSLALAELLFKGSGHDSLDAARTEHKHHGLLFKLRPHSSKVASLEIAAKSMVACPMEDSAGQRRGTFELWHRLSREMPAIGKLTEYHSNRSVTSSYPVIMHAADKNLDPLPQAGVSLLDCLKAMPGMLEILGRYGLSSELVRGTLSVDLYRDPLLPIPFPGGAGQALPNPKQIATLIVHPGPSRQTEQFLSNLLLKTRHVADFLDRIDYHDVAAGGCIIRWLDSLPADRIPVNIPMGSNWKTEEARFLPKNGPLNEFGLYYVALFISGCYARYYPDKWIADVEASSPLALGIEEMLGQAEERMALQTLSELTRVYHVPQ